MMSGGVSWLTLPAGYLGSGLIGAALIACGFDTNASKIASIVLAVFFVFTLWWARRNLLCVPFFLFFFCSVFGGLGWLEDWDGWLIMVVAVYRTWVLLLGMSGLIILFWFLKGGEVLRYLVSPRIKTVSLPLPFFFGFLKRACVIGSVHWRHVVPLCPLGRDRYALSFFYIFGNRIAV
jgi:hypothetical protein